MYTLKSKAIIDSFYVVAFQCYVYFHPSVHLHAFFVKRTGIKLVDFGSKHRYFYLFINRDLDWTPVVLPLMMMTKFLNLTILSSSNSLQTTHKRDISRIIPFIRHTFSMNLEKNLCTLTQHFHFHIWGIVLPTWLTKVNLGTSSLIHCRTWNYVWNTYLSLIISRIYKNRIYSEMNPTVA